MSLRGRGFVRTIQIILGLALLVFGLNVFLQFMPAVEFSEAGGAFAGALFGTEYIFPIIGIVFLLTGLLFTLNKYSALSAILLFPVTLNIILFHIFLDVSTMLFGLIIFILNVYMIRIHWKSYNPMLKK